MARLEADLLQDVVKFHLAKKIRRSDRADEVNEITLDFFKELPEFVIAGARQPLVNHHNHYAPVGLPRVSVTFTDYKIISERSRDKKIYEILRGNILPPPRFRTFVI